MNPNASSADRHWSVRSMFIVLTAAMSAVLLLTIVLIVVRDRGQSLEDRKVELHNLAEVVLTVADHYRQQAVEGKLSEDEAKQQALADISAMRFDHDNYFVIQDYTGRIIMHPVNKDIVGKDNLGLKDANGKFFVRELVDVVAKNGEGYVEYVWPKAGQKEPVPKLSYVKGFSSWNWIVLTGIYIDDLDAAAWRDAIPLILGGLLMMAFLAASLFLVRNMLLKMLGGEPAEAVAMTRQIASGDLTADIRLLPGDRTSLLAGIKDMQGTLRGMIAEIVQGSEQLSTSARDLRQSAQEVTAGAHAQSEAASSIAAAVEEMTVSIDVVAQNTQEAHGISVQSDQISASGAGVINDAASEMRRIAETVRSSAAIITELGHQTDQISSVVQTIKEIADQTNLLALNAAIEAARAGEQGRGFAVVADEVRKLAERTSQSTSEIGVTVQQIQSGTRQAVASMEAGVTQVEAGVDLAAKAGESIEQIKDGAQRVTSVVSDITSSIREQGIASAEIAKNVERIAQMAEEGANAVARTAASAEDLQTLSAALHAAVSRFKTR